jgi:hypothetical protein
VLGGIKGLEAAELAGLGLGERGAELELPKDAEGAAWGVVVEADEVDEVGGVATVFAGRMDGLDEPVAVAAAGDLARPREGARIGGGARRERGGAGRRGGALGGVAGEVAVAGGVRRWLGERRGLEGIVGGARRWRLRRGRGRRGLEGIVGDRGAGGGAGEEQLLGGAGGGEVDGVEALAVMGAGEGGADHAGGLVEGVGELKEDAVVGAGVGDAEEGDVGRDRAGGGGGRGSGCGSGSRSGGRALGRGRGCAGRGGPGRGGGGRDGGRGGWGDAEVCAARGEGGAVGALAGVEAAGVEAHAVVLRLEVRLDVGGGGAEVAGELQEEGRVATGGGVAGGGEVLGEGRARAEVVGVGRPEAAEGVGELGAAVDEPEPALDGVAVDAEVAGEVDQEVRSLTSGAGARFCEGWVGLAGHALPSKTRKRVRIQGGSARAGQCLAASRTDPR